MEYSTFHLYLGHPFEMDTGSVKSKKLLVSDDGLVLYGKGGACQLCSSG